ncbi:MAG: hypothetical protein H7320_10355 [Ferruginibacter sp.]|nr:hypothetical protein [Ferruginibacter sp.]
MQKIWEAIKNYYLTLGKNYHVDPAVFLGIHVLATPLFLLAAAWLIKNYQQKKSILLPVIIAVLIFNAANIYLVMAGKNIQWWIYAILAVTTIVSGYFSFKKIHHKINSH